MKFQRYNPSTILIYAMEIFRLWILLSGSSVDGLEVGLMINLNRYGDSLVGWNLPLRLYRRQTRQCRGQRSNFLKFASPLDL